MPNIPAEWTDVANTEESARRYDTGRGLTVLVAVYRNTTTFAPPYTVYIESHASGEPSLRLYSGDDWNVVLQVVNEATTEKLAELHQKWCAEQGLECHSADEMLFMEGLSGEQRRHLSEFCITWDAVQDAEGKIRRAKHHP